MNKLNGKNVLITGSSRGIGKAIALKLAQNGCNICICSHSSEEDLEKCAAEIRAYGVQCEAVTGDVGTPEGAEFIFNAALKLGSVDILINNAGISYVGLLQDLTPNEWNRIVSVNLSSVFYMSRLAIPGMVKNKCGRILNISSVWGLVGASCESAYSATKGAINSLTKALAKELAPSGISVNAIACGYIDTVMNNEFTKEEQEATFEEIPMGRPASPEEVAELALKILESPEYLTGEVIKFDGGWI